MTIRRTTDLALDAWHHAVYAAATGFACEMLFEARVS
jgi:hypothetical protein